jgi:biopolymer transport protein ExbD
MAKKIPEINTASMADISFLLLTFFLLTSSIDTDSGLLRKLPPLPTKDQEDIKVKERNVLPILINAYDKLMVKGKIMEVKDLRKTVKEFFLIFGREWGKLTE